MDAIPGTVTHGTTKRLLLLLQSGGNNLRREIEVSPQKVNAFVSEKPVVMHPCKRLPHVLLRLEALHQFDYLQIRDSFDQRMLR